MAEIRLKTELGKVELQLFADKEQLESQIRLCFSDDMQRTMLELREFILLDHVFSSAKRRYGFTYRAGIGYWSIAGHETKNQESGSKPERP